MTFKLEIEMENDAFLPIPGDELGRILLNISDKVDGCNIKQCAGVCHDSYGNKVGKYWVEQP